MNPTLTMAQVDRATTPTTTPLLTGSEREQTTNKVRNKVRFDDKVTVITIPGRIPRRNRSSDTKIVSKDCVLIFGTMLVLAALMIALILYIVISSK